MTAHQHDRLFRLWRAGLIESMPRLMSVEDTLAVMPFRRVLLTLAKKHGLSMTCEALESNL